MKRERSGIVFLLLSLLIFSAAVAMMYGDTQQDPVVASKPLSLTALPAELLMQELSPLIFSGSLEKFVEAVHGFSASQAQELFDYLIKYYKQQLTRDDFLTILYGLVHYFPQDQQAQFHLFDALVKYSFLQKGAPFAYVAARSQFPQVISPLLQWARIQPYRNIPAIKNGERAALVFAVKENSLPAIQTLVSQGVTVDAGLATDLLWVVGRIGKSSGRELIDYLISLGADVNSKRSGYTLLGQAVEQNNMVFVQALVEHDALVNDFADPRIGSPLQIAIQKRLVPLELYLREHGARE